MVYTDRCDTSRIRINNEDAKVIFKKSFQSSLSNSQTGSRVSESYPKSRISKHDLKNPVNCMDNASKKRDLSIETDLCILKRYYRNKKKRNSKSSRSNKSRYSTYLDSDVTNHIVEHPDIRMIHKDVKTLMLHNLKYMINSWIENHIMNDDEAKRSIDTILNSVLHKYSSDIRNTSSCGTYVLHKPAQSHLVRNRKVETASITCCKTLRGVCQSNQVVAKHYSICVAPFSKNETKIISTLSEPTMLYAQGDTTDKQFNYVVPAGKSVHSSMCDLLAISAKSLTKRCATCNKEEKKRHVAFTSEKLYRIASSTTVVKENYANFHNQMKNHNVVNVLKYSHQPSCNSNQKHEISQTISTDKDSEMSIVNKAIQYKSVGVLCKQKVTPVYITGTKDNIKYKMTLEDKGVTTLDKIDEILYGFRVKRKPKTVSKHKKLYKRTKSNTSKRNLKNRNERIVQYANSDKINCSKGLKREINLLNPCRIDQKHINSNEKQKKIKIDICLNLCSKCENLTKDVSTDITSPTVKYTEPNAYNDDKIHDSQDQNIFSFQRDIQQEIRELKHFLNDIVTSTKMVVKTCLQKSYKKTNSANHLQHSTVFNLTPVSSFKCQAGFNLSNFSKDFKNGQPHLCPKISIELKNAVGDHLACRRIKKLASSHIIDSESLTHIADISERICSVTKLNKPKCPTVKSKSRLSKNADKELVSLFSNNDVVNKNQNCLAHTLLRVQNSKCEKIYVEDAKINMTHCNTINNPSKIPEPITNDTKNAMTIAYITGIDRIKTKPPVKILYSNTYQDSKVLNKDKVKHNKTKFKNSVMSTVPKDIKLELEYLTGCDKMPSLSTNTKISSKGKDKKWKTYCTKIFFCIILWTPILIIIFFALYSLVLNKVKSTQSENKILKENIERLKILFRDHRSVKFLKLSELGF